jgi:hypothetical protein
MIDLNRPKLELLALTSELVTRIKWRLEGNTRDGILKKTIYEFF